MNFDILKLKTIRPQHEALGNTPQKLYSHSRGRRTKVYCFRLNFNISKSVYSSRRVKNTTVISSTRSLNICVQNV